jgi:acyl-CoA hydrolase
MAEPRGSRSDSARPARFTEVEAMVEDALSQVGKDIVLGAPVGLGKSVPLVNEIYRRASDDPSLSLRIITALTLARPRASSELERRLVEPLADRIFGDYPEPAYLEPLKRSKLPPNITVSEFYFAPGSMLASPQAQRAYINSNYTHVVRDLLDDCINVLVQMVAEEEVGGRSRLSLSCNPDLALDLGPRMRHHQRCGRPVALLGHVNRQLPFMPGDAEVEPTFFDALLEGPGCSHDLFGPPNRPVGAEDYAIGLAASALVRDGGTLQLGIGALSDAVTWSLELRHRNNDLYRAVLEASGLPRRHGGVLRRVGGTDRFEKGLFAATEMLVPGFQSLYTSGILKRRVYDHPEIQRLLDEGRISETVTPETLDALVESGVVRERLSRDDVTVLHRFGVLCEDVEWRDGELILAGRRLAADLRDPETREALHTAGLGEELAGGAVAHAGFFLGPKSFYRWLRELPLEERRGIRMTDIQWVNELYGTEGAFGRLDGERLKRLQRKDARFLNTAMKVTLTGLAVSDGLEDGRVVSGVGGQYNFVAMAQELADGRSVLMVRSTRGSRGETVSNLVWSYGHSTIPRHLRDLVVTEYGVADLRGKTDEEVAEALVEVADARFQEDLVARAQRAGKLRKGYRLPDSARSNRPRRLREVFAPYRERDLFPELPYGTDLTDEELVLAKALRRLADRFTWKGFVWPRGENLTKALRPPAAARPYLERMELDRPQSTKERLLQRLLVFALALSGAV